MDPAFAYTRLKIKPDFPRLTHDDDGDVYQKVEPEKKLGKGTYGSVYMVKCKRQVSDQQHPLAKKEQKIKSWAGLDLLKGELQVMDSLRNGQNVVLLKDASFNPMNFTAYIYMEYLEGGDLWHFVSAVRTSGFFVHPLLVYRLASHIAFGLSELHKTGVIHRDLKPDNVLLSKRLTVEMNAALWTLTGNSHQVNWQGITEACRTLSEASDRLAVLSDFGLAREEDGIPRTSASTKGYEWLEKYHAPEMVATNKQTMQGDIYSFGTTLYFLCNGSLPTRADAVKEAPLPKGRYHPALQRLFKQCTDEGPEKRPQPGAIYGILNGLDMERSKWVYQTTLRKGNEVKNHSESPQISSNMAPHERQQRAAQNDRAAGPEWKLQAEELCKPDNQAAVREYRKEQARLERLAEQHRKDSRPLGWTGTGGQGSSNHQGVGVHGHQQTVTQQGKQRDPDIAPEMARLSVGDGASASVNVGGSGSNHGPSGKGKGRVQPPTGMAATQSMVPGHKPTRRLLPKPSNVTTIPAGSHVHGGKGGIGQDLNQPQYEYTMGAHGGGPRGGRPIPPTTTTTNITTSISTQPLNSANPAAATTMPHSHNAPPIQQHTAYQPALQHVNAPSVGGYQYIQPRQVQVIVPSQAGAANHQHQAAAAAAAALPQHQPVHPRTHQRGIKRGRSLEDHDTLSHAGSS